jgi:hypothetical protein
VLGGEVLYLILKEEQKRDLKRTKQLECNILMSKRANGIMFGITMSFSGTENCQLCYERIEITGGLPHRPFSRENKNIVSYIEVYRIFWG